MKVEVPKPRSTITNTADGVEIVIPARRNLFQVAFLCLWLVGLLVVEVVFSGMLIQSVINGQFSDDEILALFWIAILPFPWLFALYAFLWVMWGRERITLQTNTLSIRGEIPGRGRTREYDLQHVSNLRLMLLASFIPLDLATFLNGWGIAAGMIAFDYGAKTIRFGASIGEPEARMIVECLRSHHQFGGVSTTGVPVG